MKQKQLGCHNSKGNKNNLDVITSNETKQLGCHHSKRKKNITWMSELETKQKQNLNVTTPNKTKR